VGFIGVGVAGVFAVKHAVERDDATLPSVTDAPGSLDVALDESGVVVSGELVEAAIALPADKLAVVPRVVAAVEEIYDRREASGITAPLPVRVKIAPNVPALRAGSLIATVGRMGADVTVAVGATKFRLHYLPASPVPVESFFHLLPATGVSYAIERERVTRDVRTHAPPCRERTGRREISSVSAMRDAAGVLCASTVDCVDHVEFGLSPELSFGDAAPWIASAVGLLEFPDLRFVVAGTEPFPDTIACGDGGAHAP
jgi:hypothetical protein